MPSLVQMMTGAVEARAQQLAIECPVLSVDFWDKIETAPVETKEDYFLAGRQFLATSMKDYASKRAFRMPVGSYDVGHISKLGGETLNNFNRSFKTSSLAPGRSL
jgi:hypothetical protein